LGFGVRLDPQQLAGSIPGLLITLEGVREERFAGVLQLLVVRRSLADPGQEDSLQCEKPVAGKAQADAGRNDRQRKRGGDQQRQLALELGAHRFVADHRDCGHPPLVNSPEAFQARRGGPLARLARIGALLGSR